MATKETIFVILKNEHEEISMLLKQVQRSAAPGSRREPLTKLRRALLSHIKAEEEVFYSRLERIGSARSEVRENLQEHNRLERLLDQLDATSMGGKGWESSLQDLDNSLASHVAEEEGKLFALARKFIDEKEAQELGQRFQNEKSEALARLGGAPTKA